MYTYTYMHIYIYIERERLDVSMAASSRVGAAVGGTRTVIGMM